MAHLHKLSQLNGDVGMGSQKHVVFMDGVTGYLGRWTLFWLLEELSDERVAVLIRPKQKGDKAQGDVDQRLEKVLSTIGMSDQRHRVTAIPGELSSPGLGNAEALETLQADCWLHIAGDVTFKKLGDKSSLTTNLDYTINFVETAAQVASPPRTLAHTSTFYVFEKAGGAAATYQVPEEFHDPMELEHHNAYGYSKLKAELYLQSLVQDNALPFNLLIYRPDIIMHHIPVKQVAARNPGLIVDDFKVAYQLLAAMLGKTAFKIPNGPTINQPLKCLPVNPNSILYISDVDSVCKAMMQLSVLFGDGGMTPEKGYQIFHLVNRWRPVSAQFLRELCEAYDPERTKMVRQVTPAQYREEVVPNLSWVEKLYYAALIDPFIGYMDRPVTEASTANVDSLLGEDWHNLHPNHQVTISEWLQAGGLQAIEKNFGNAGED